MYQKSRPSLVQIMACCLFAVKPLSDTMLGTKMYCQWDHLEQTSVKFHSNYNSFHLKKTILKCHLENGGHFVLPAIC